jgi:hypothetical protein
MMELLEALHLIILTNAVRRISIFLEYEVITSLNLRNNVFLENLDIPLLSHLTVVVGRDIVEK